MRLKRLEIENFKGIGERQVIEIKPITLLFGPNSVGKSTILQAIQYISAVLQGNLDGIPGNHGGENVLVGFPQLVHNHDLGKTIKIKAVIRLNNNFHEEWFPMNAYFSDPKEGEDGKISINYLKGNDLSNRFIFEIGIRIEVGWREQEIGGLETNHSFVKRLEVELNGSLAYEISHNQNIVDIFGKDQASYFNFDHELFKKLEQETNKKFLSGKPDPASENPLYERVVKFEKPSGDLSNWKKAARLKYRRYFDKQEEYSPLAKAIGDLTGLIDDNNEFKIPIHLMDDGIPKNNGAIPNLESEFKFPFKVLEIEIDSSENRTRNLKHETLNELLNEIILQPLRCVSFYLSESLHLGPLREIPGRSYIARKEPAQSNWRNGLAAWDLVSSKGVFNHTAELVNRWLEKYFKINYRIEKFSYKEIPDVSDVTQFFDGEVDILNLERLRESYRNLPTYEGFRLRDLKRNILVDANDVGVGVSQMIPVMVAVLSDHQLVGLATIEQPELHVHPAIQVVMGDMFISGATANKGEATLSGDDTDEFLKTLLIETHSEHIMLRLLRRVREQSESKARQEFGLKFNELSVVYIESRGDGVRFRPLRVTPDGDFLDQWPGGFFDERDEELFF